MMKDETETDAARKAKMALEALKRAGAWLI
jgi:hypothetical protein